MFNTAGNYSKLWPDLDISRHQAGSPSLDTIADKVGSLKVFFSQGNSEGSIYEAAA